MLNKNARIKFLGETEVFVVTEVEGGFALINEATSEQLFGTFTSLDRIERALRFEVLSGGESLYYFVPIVSVDGEKQFHEVIKKRVADFEEAVRYTVNVLNTHWKVDYEEIKNN